MIYSQFALFMLRLFNAVQRIEPSYGVELPQNGGQSMGPQDVGAQQMRMKRIQGDIQIGALFPIRRKKKGTESCGEIWEQYGIHRTEAALMAIDSINGDKNILPNIRLGIDIRDDCWTERTAMEQTIEFIREAMGSDPAAVAADVDANRQCAGQAGNRTDLILAAVIGPGNSDMSIATQNLLQVFHIPQVGYSATSSDLSDKSDFKYYMRVVPSDVYQARALMDIALYFGWTYIAVIYSNGNYGEKGFEQMSHYRLQLNKMCFAHNEKIDSLAPPAKFDQLIWTLATMKAKPRAAVCFCEGDTIKKVFEAIQRYQYGTNSSLGIQWIGSESWSDRLDVVEGVENVAMGAISIRIYSPNVTAFDEHYLKFKPSTNLHNPWFRDFWEERFLCSLSPATLPLYRRTCTGDENLRSAYKQDPKLSQVMNSIYTIAYGLDAMYRNICANHKAPGLCAGMRKLNGSLLFEYMLNVRFNDSHGQQISFDRNGDPPARYEVLNFQGDKFVRAGEWRSIISVTDNGTIIYKYNLTIHPNKWVWNDQTRGMKNAPTSICSTPCEHGHVKKYQGNICCWTCVRCLDNEYILDESTCRNCTLGEWPNENRSACFKLEIEYLRSSSPEAIVVMAIACLGILATIYTVLIFARFNSTPVVKATTRELSYIILAGFLLCYSTTFIIVVRPSTATCYILRILPGLAFAMIYGALLTKTNRIARILAGSKKRILTKKPRFLSTKAQVLITWLIVGVELTIITAILIYEPAKADYDYSMPKRVLLVCKANTISFLAPFGFDFFLISLCTLYAIKTRNLPENFNEAKFIGFTMYTTCIIWLAFITIYFGSNNKGITMCLSFSLSASVALVLLFFPKLYIILFQPHKNVRSSYATTKVIRCHFGTSQSSTSAHDSHRTSSSGPKTGTSTVSRPSSKISSRSPTDAVDSASRFKKVFMRDSVHVTIPQAGGVGGGGVLGVGGGGVGGQIGVGAVGLVQSGQPSSISMKEQSLMLMAMEESAMAGGGRGFGRAYFQNELSVIEESLMSHDEIRPASSSGPESVDQQQRTTKSECCQTDADVFEDFVRRWWAGRRSTLSPSDDDVVTAERQSIDCTLRRRSASVRDRSAGVRRRSASDRNDDVIDEESGWSVPPSAYQFKRTLTEYRKGSRRVRKHSEGNDRMKLSRQPSVVNEAEETSAVGDEPSTSNNNDRQQISSPKELRQKMRQMSLPENRPDLRRSQRHASLDASAQKEGRRRSTQPIGINSSRNDIVAQTLGGAFQTCFGMTVPVDEKQDFFIRTEVVDAARDEEEWRHRQPKTPSLVNRSLATSLDTLILPGTPEYVGAQARRDGSNGSIGFPRISSDAVEERRGSLIARLGYSLRKKLRNFSGETAAKVVEEQLRMQNASLYNDELAGGGGNDSGDDDDDDGDNNGDDDDENNENDGHRSRLASMQMTGIGRGRLISGRQSTELTSTTSTTTKQQRDDAGNDNRGGPNNDDADDENKEEDDDDQDLDLSLPGGKLRHRRGWSRRSTRQRRRQGSVKIVRRLESDRSPSEVFEEDVRIMPQVRIVSGDQPSTASAIVTTTMTSMTTTQSVSTSEPALADEFQSLLQSQGIEPIHLTHSTLV